MELDTTQIISLWVAGLVAFATFCAALAAGLQVYQTYKTQKISLYVSIFVGVGLVEGKTIPDQIAWSITNQGLRIAYANQVWCSAIDLTGKRYEAWLIWDNLPKRLEPGESVGGSFTITDDYSDSHYLDIIVWDSINGRHYAKQDTLRRLNTALKEKRKRKKND